MKNVLRMSVLLLATISLFIFSYQSQVETSASVNTYESRRMIKEEVYYITVEPVEPHYIVTEREIAGIGATQTNISKKVDKSKKTKSYTEDELKLLACIIENEAGSDFCTDEHQRAIASVVINRVNSDYYPDTIKEVIYENGQYAIGNNFDNPSDRAFENAKYVLENGSTLPDNCIFQSEYKQGDGVYTKFETIISTTYICYKD